jgi:hypothetical protein
VPFVVAFPLSPICLLALDDTLTPLGGEGPCASADAGTSKLLPESWMNRRRDKRTY